MNMKVESKKSGLKLKKLRSWHLVPSLHGKIDGKKLETMTDYFLDSKITADGDFSQEIKTLAPWEKSYGQPRQCIKKQRHYSSNKALNSQSYGFSSSHVWMCDLDHKER